MVSTPFRPLSSHPLLEFGSSHWRRCPWVQRSPPPLRPTLWSARQARGPKSRAPHSVKMPLIISPKSRAHQRYGGAKVVPRPWCTLGEPSVSSAGLRDARQTRQTRQTGRASRSDRRTELCGQTFAPVREGAQAARPRPRRPSAALCQGSRHLREPHSDLPRSPREHPAHFCKRVVSSAQTDRETDPSGPARLGGDIYYLSPRSAGRYTLVGSARPPIDPLGVGPGKEQSERLAPGASGSVDPVSI